MTLQPPLNRLFDIFSLPTPSQAKMDFCHGNKPSHVANWGAALPINRTVYASAALYKALPEITVIKTSGDQRLGMLESIRPYAHQCINALTKNFLNSPLMMPEGAMKSAVVCQALQRHLNTGYVLALQEMCEKQRSADHDFIALAAHRALSGLSIQLLRSYELYTAPPPKLWQQLHSIYLIAEQLDILNVAVADTQMQPKSSISIRQLYFRVLLLACTNPNQLTQTEITRIATALESWSSMMSLDRVVGQHDVYSVSMYSNSPPISKLLEAKDTAAEDIRYLHLQDLVTALEKRIDGDEGALNVPVGLSTATLQHCLIRWKDKHQRSTPRRATQGDINVIVGLTNIHAHLTKQGKGTNSSKNQTGDRDTISRQARFNANKLSAEIDPWERVFDAGIERDSQGHPLSYDFKSSQTTEPEVQENPLSHSTSIIDTSAGGCCLRWTNTIPPQVKSGELIALNQSNRNLWSIAVIRWVRQIQNATHIGVQLLAPAAIPVAAQIIQKTGENSEYLRALKIPENKALSQPDTLLTGSMPFRTRQKVLLSQHHQQTTIQLTDCVFSTSGTNQFTYRILEDLNTRSSGSNEDINSRWR